MTDQEKDQIAALQEKTRRFKRMGDNLGKLVVWVDGLEFTRVSGLAICEMCGLEFFDHPKVGLVGEVGNDSFLHIGCDGKLLKL